MQLYLFRQDKFYLKLESINSITLAMYSYLPTTTSAELDMGRVCHGPSLYGPSLLWAEFVMGRVCYWPSCPVTHANIQVHNSLEQELFAVYVSWYSLIAVV